MERVDLGRTYPGVQELWRNGGMWDSQARKIVLGVLADKRWYACWFDGYDDPPACVYKGEHAEHYARRTAERWMRTLGGEWVQA